MDIRKFKVKQILIFCLLTVIGNYSFAQVQYDIPIYVTTSGDSIANLKSRISTNLDVDFLYERTDTAFRWAYGGYNNLIVDKQVFPIHLEEFDDFNIAFLKSGTEIKVIFSGAQGAIKNEYILQRDEAFKKFSNRKGFWSQSEETFDTSMDSLINSWQTKLNKSIHTQLFKTDEKAYYDSYSLYMKLLKNEISKGHIDLMSLQLEEFPKAIYSIERFYTTIPAYKNVSLAYHYANVKNLERSRDIRKYYYNLPVGPMQAGLREQLMKEVSERHPKAELFYKSMDYRYDPRPESEKALRRNIKRSPVGSDFVFPNAMVLGSKSFDFTQLGNKKVYFYIYDLNDPNLDYNLKLWNSLVLGSNDKEAYYIACGLQSQNSEIEIWRNLQLAQRVAGVNVIALKEEASVFTNTYGIQYFPRIMIIDNERKIYDPNVNVPFIKLKMF